MYTVELGLGIKTRLLAVFISFGLSGYAQHYDQTNSYFSHLAEVNKEWLHHKEVCPEGTIAFRSDVDRIQLHLNLVIEYLKSNSPSNLNSAQLANRMYLLGRLQQYADNKVFPVNKYHTSRQPYFVDDAGTNCAVGQMIDLSGHKQLVAKISAAHNYDYIEDIKTEGVKEWASEFGFAMEELKWIQPAYAPTVSIEQVLDGTNGSVNKVERNYLNGSVTIAGEFTELDNLPCLNIGIYSDNQLTCLGTGVEGVINDFIHQPGEVYVFGELNYNGEVFPAAKYDGSTWNYINIPNRAGAICTSADNGFGYQYQFAMAISHHSIPAYQEIWYFLNDNTWEKRVMLKGVVLDIAASSHGRVHVGHLDSVIVYDSNEMIDTTLTVNNVLLRTNYTNLWYGIGDNISDTVNTVVEIGGALIFGGTCGYQSNSSDICISRYFNSTLQPLLLNDYGAENFSVKTIAYESGNEFTFGGDFYFMPVVGTYGSNLATYNLVYNLTEPIAIFDKAVNSLTYFNGELFIGGSFQTNLGAQSINFLARQLTSVGIDEFSSDETVNIYPNPFTTSIDVEGVENGASYIISNIDGRMLKQGKVMNEKINGLDVLPNGMFLLRLESRGGAIVKKIIK